MIWTNHRQAQTREESLGGAAPERVSRPVAPNHLREQKLLFVYKLLSIH